MVCARGIVFSPWLWHNFTLMRTWLVPLKSNRKKADRTVRKYQIEVLAAVGTLLLLGICLSVERAGSAVPLKAAVFNFELVDTSHEGALAGKRADETARLGLLDSILAERLAASGRYKPVDLTPANGAIEKAGGEMTSCNGCAEDIAKTLGADVAVIGWVQKVSNLILNINVEIREAGTGKVMQRVSADIRGNTDESWRRGLEWLLKNRILRPERSNG